MSVVSQLTVEQVRGRSAVTTSRAYPPLQLLNPANHGGGAWVYQSSLGGGFVRDDEVALAVNVGAGATLFLSSQASSKVYRSARSLASLDATVDAGGALVLWPEPVTCFAGASLVQRQKVALGEGASLLFVDAFSAGRVARGERWAFTSLESRVEVSMGGQPWTREAIRLDPRHGALETRLEGLDAFATVVVCGPAFEALSAGLTSQLAARPVRERVQVTCSPRVGGVVVRVAAPRVDGLLVELQALLREAVSAFLGDAPLTPFGRR
jgi:urease accessory protein